MLRSRATFFDRLLTAVGKEHRRELAERLDSSEERRAQRVLRLLDTAELRYDFAAHHVGLIASGKGVEAVVRELIAPLDARLLLVLRDDTTLSVKGGIRARIDSAPDAPISKVVLQMQGAKKGLIINSRDCAGRSPRQTCSSRRRAPGGWGLSR